MSIPQHAIITAAGMGTRLGLNFPKCLVKIAGKSIIEHQLALLSDVPDVRVVVGFMESEVIRQVSAIRDDVVFVRNPDFHSTSNTYSLHLASHDVREPFLIIDGDVMISPESFAEFLSAASTALKDGTDLIVVSPSTTEEAVFVEFDKEAGRVLGFQTSPKTPLEWSGLGLLANIRVDREKDGFVFKALEEYLPLRGIVLETHEIDTPADLEKARSHFQQLYS